MPRYLLDTNVLLRFLRQDHKTLSPRATELFAQASEGRAVLVVFDLTIAEALWVLTSHYEEDLRDVAAVLSRLIASPGIRCDNAAIIRDALDRTEATGLDFMDCYLAARAAHGGETIATFDKDLQRFDDIALWPGVHGSHPR